jgi:hypothetical protein
LSRAGRRFTVASPDEGAAVQESPGAVEAWLRFCEGVTSGRVDEFDEIVSHEANLVIGTAPDEFVTTRAGMRFGFETEGVSLTSRSARGYEEGSLAWIVDEPTFGLPDGAAFECRVTAILRREDGGWKLVHAHFSVGVPDDEVVELQKRWSLES